LGATITNPRGFFNSKKENKKNYQLGLALGLNHKKQGIPEADLISLANYAREKNKIILFRPVEFIAKSLHEEKKYPTKDFNIKGKSASWGAWAGFIPIDQAYSKLASASIEQVQKYNKNVRACIKQGYAIATDLRITKKRYQELVALRIIFPQSQQEDNEFIALDCPTPAQDQLKLCYAKEINATSEYAIYTAEKQPFQVLADPNLKRPFIPDFDLLAIFNPWEDFGRENIRPNPDISYEKRLRKLSIRERINLAETEQDFYARELPNLGNITQQTLKTINEMNDALDKGPYLQCIHHNDDAGSPASNPKLNYPITVLLPQHFGIFSSSLLLIETPEQFVYFIECINPLGYRVEVNHLWEKSIQFAAKKSFNQKKVFFDLNQNKLNSADEMLTVIGLPVDKTWMHEIMRIFRLIIQAQINFQLEYVFEVIQACLMVNSRLLSLWCFGIELLLTKKLLTKNTLSSYLQFLNTLEDDTSGFRKVIQKLDKIQNTKPEQLESSADLEKIQYRLSP
jgi:hypothetical protein